HLLSFFSISPRPPPFPPLPLPAALPIYPRPAAWLNARSTAPRPPRRPPPPGRTPADGRAHPRLGRRFLHPPRPLAHGPLRRRPEDRKSTRLNSSHQIISYAVFCLKKKQK